MDTIYWIYSFLSILALLSIFLGLWIARKFLPSSINWLHTKDRNDILSQPVAKFIIWLALGGLFTLPLLDFVRWLGYFANFVIVPVGQTGGFTTSLGIIPSRLYYGFYLILMAIIYGIAVWYTKDYLSMDERFDRIERIFIGLSIASLVYHANSNIFTYIFAFQLPSGVIQQNYGIPGFLIEVVFGFAFLFLILLGVNRFLTGNPARSH